MSIASAYYQSPIGELKISATEDVITELTFFPEKQDADHDKTSTPVLQKCIQELDKYFSGEIKSFDIPVSFGGTEFQSGVWNALCKIPYGNTISYLELSKRLGNVKAIRAVGTANGKNKIAIIVPCHRVIGSNGNLIGYAGELWRKQWLLNHEAKHAHGVQELF